MRKSLCADRTIHDRHNSAIHYERCYSQSESPYGRHYGFLCLLNSITGMPITLTPEARRNTTEWLIAINAKLILAPSHAANIRDAALHLSLHKLAQSVESFFIFLFFSSLLLLSPKGDLHPRYADASCSADVSLQPGDRSCLLAQQWNYV